jgi:hypothetical protein
MKLLHVHRALRTIRLVETNAAVRARVGASETDLGVQPDKAAIATRAPHQLLLEHPEHGTDGQCSDDRVEAKRTPRQLQVTERECEYRHHADPATDSCQECPQLQVIPDGHLLRRLRGFLLRLVLRVIGSRALKKHRAADMGSERHFSVLGALGICLCEDCGLDFLVRLRLRSGRRGLRARDRRVHTDCADKRKAQRDFHALVPRVVDVLVPLSCSLEGGL